MSFKLQFKSYSEATHNMYSLSTKSTKHTSSPFDRKTKETHALRAELLENVAEGANAATEVARRAPMARVNFILAQNILLEWRMLKRL